MIDRRAVHAALDKVVDPCSNAMGEPLGLDEMGLVQTVSVDESAGAIEVVLRLTSPCCAYGPMMARAAERELAALPGVRVARVTIDHAAEWIPADMSAAAAQRLDRRRVTTRSITGVQPHDWAPIQEATS